MASGVFTLKQQTVALGQGAWTNQKPLAVDYLVVAGGGTGTSGGGAGGLLQGNLPVTAGTSYTVTVGAGGAGGSNNNGNNSVFGSITTTGGGGGISVSGGSGSGGYATGSYGGQAVSGQGNQGGNGDTSGTQSGGGGGGAGSRGLPAIGTIAGNGGAGIASDISGTRTVYAGGGGGGAAGTGGGLGGAGGGGQGSVNGTPVTAGTANTGGGGGGAYYSANANGGSGIVILSYPDTYAAAASTTGSPTISTSGSGSLLFDGSNSYVQINTTSALFNFGTGNFTLEGWFYFTSNPQSTSPSIVSAQNNGFIGWRPNATGMELFTPGIGNVVASDAFSLPTSVWMHLAVVRSSGVVSFYKDGARQGTTKSDTNNYAAPNAEIIIGRTGTGGPVIPGYISNLRIVKGVAVYSGTTYTVSASPLTAISGTSLLYNTVSGSWLADSSGNGFGAINPGLVYWNALSPFATGLGYKNRVYTWTSSGSITF